MRGAATFGRSLAASGAALALLSVCLLLKGCALEARRGPEPDDWESVPWWAASAPARAGGRPESAEQLVPPSLRRAPGGPPGEREGLLRLERARRALAEGGQLLGEVRREADAAHVLLRERLARQAEQRGTRDGCRAAHASPDCTLLADDALDMLGGGALRASLDCGVVSNPGAMAGSGLGQAVDSHATVVRVNAVPPAELEGDFGRRTDVYFIASERNLKPTYRTKEFRGHGWAFHGLAQVMTQGSDLAAWCNTSRRAGCPFGALVFKDLEKPFHGYWYRATLPVGSIAPTTMQVVRHLYALKFNVTQAEDLAWMRLTNGFVATLTFAAICHNLTAYGMRSLMASESPGSQRREASLLWELFSGQVPAVYSGLPDFSARYRRCLTAKARAGCFHMVQ